MKIFPAGTGEKVQYLAHDFNDNTVRFALVYGGMLRPEILKRAAAALAESITVLHSSFIAGNITACWHVNKTYEESDYFTLMDTCQDPLAACHKALLSPVSPTGKVQLHCTLVRGTESCAVVLRISHLCVDGGDGKYLLYKLAEAYELIARTGSAEGLELKHGSRATEKMYQELTPKEYLSLIKPSLGDVKTGFPFTQEEGDSLRLAVRSIPAEVMDAARKRAKEMGATVNDLLLASCYRAYAGLPGADTKGAVSIMSMMDLRRHCRNGESEGLCNMSGFLPTVLQEGIQGDFAQTLGRIAEQTRKAKENPLAGMEGMPLIHSAVWTTPMRLLLEVSERLYGSLSIGMTNLGNLPCEQLTMDGLRPVDGLFVGPVKKKPAMQVSAASFDGRAVLCSASECTGEDLALLQEMLDCMAEEVKAFAGISR